MDPGRRLEWILARLEHMGVGVQDLPPTLASFRPFFRVAKATFPASTSFENRFKYTKELFGRYAAQHHPTAVEERPPGSGRVCFKQFDLNDTSKWPPRDRSKWDLLFKDVSNTYCLTCSKKVKSLDFGEYCGLKCIPRRCCGACLKELTSTEVVEYRPTRADSERSRKISDLTRMVGLKPDVEAIARAPKCCWVSKPWLNRGEPTLKEEPCADCDALPLKRLNFEKEFYLKGVWSEDWPAVQRELDKLRAIPREPPQKFTFHEFGCKTPDCPEPGRLMDQECDDFTYKNRMHAKMMAEFDERQKKRARHE
jgi:hypothetical protein